MKQTINKDQFRHAFQNMGRGEQFSYEALGLLFDYLEECEAGSDTEFELDVIGLCCDYSENTANEIISSYGLDDSGLNETEKQALVSDYLNENTFLIGETNNESYLYANH